MITRREILIAQLKAKEKVNKALAEHDRVYKQEKQNASNQTQENVPSQPVPNNGG